MENTRIEKREFDYELIADEGYVITNFKDGDEGITYFKKLRFKEEDGIPEGFYTMHQDDAMVIARAFAVAQEDEELEMLDLDDFNESGETLDNTDYCLN